MWPPQLVKRLFQIKLIRSNEFGPTQKNLENKPSVSFL